MSLPLFYLYAVHLRHVFAQMQGGKQGDRPYTAVLTEAERAKFDRSVLAYLFTTPSSGNRPLGQYTDSGMFASNSNDDVKLDEEQARKGRGVVKGHNLVNRKHLADLQAHMTVSKKATNSKRIMQPYKGHVASLRKNHRVRVLPAVSSSGAALGVLPDGEQLALPIATDAGSARSRPQPVPGLSPTPSACSGGEGQSASGRNFAAGGGSGGGGDGMSASPTTAGDGARGGATCGGFGGKTGGGGRIRGSLG